VGKSNYAWLSDALRDGGEVVTASRRLARELRHAFDSDQLEMGREAWLTPSIWTWSDWLSRQLANSSQPLNAPVLLDSHSASFLWEQCLAEDLAEDLPGFMNLARQTFDSWLKLEEWRVPTAELTASARGLDEQLFANTAKRYEEELRANGWIDMGGKAREVSKLFSRKQCSPPSRITMAGFDRINPATREVLDALEAQGSAVEQSPILTGRTSPSICSYVHLEAEMRAAGKWAREKLRVDPAAELAVVVPSLDADAAGVGRYIREGLVPGWQFGSPQISAAVNVSYGRKLAQYPAVVMALLLLRWLQRGLASRDIAILLRSRCVVGDDLGDRIRIESRLRRLPDRVWTPENFQALLSTDGEQLDANSFMGCVASFAKMRASTMGRATPGLWAERIDQLLNAMHWPGSASLDSYEFQLINRWRELLNEFARIHVVAPTMTFSEAVRRISAMASEVLYQPESGAGLVQVLGSLEAAGMEFDAVWISGLDASQWPARSNPTRFVSLALQRKYAMPDATPVDSLNFARQVLTRLISSADESILSWVVTRDDLALTPSDLLNEFSPSSIDAYADPSWFAATLIGQAVLTAECDHAPPVHPNERITGGAYTVQRHYIEPLGAFVYGRLGVRALEPIETGLSASVRGNLIHHALHNLYAEKPSQSEVKAWAGDELSNRIGSAVDMALSEQYRASDELHQRLLNLERNRLVLLLHDFVRAEGFRDAFKVVDLEKGLAYNKFGVSLGLRVDRIDRLANGDLLIIDYKTGLPKHFLNGAGDLTDLQLVVYAAAHTGPIGGLAMMNVDSRLVQGKGAGAGGFSKLYVEEWTETLARWQAEVDKSVSEMAAGDVRVNLAISVAENRPLSLISRKEELARAD